MNQVTDERESRRLVSAERLSESAKTLTSLGVEALDLEALRDVDGICFPLVIAPQEGALTDREATLQWFSEHGALIREVLRDHGALYLREFPLRGAEDFEASIDAAAFAEMPYVGGAAPREVVTSRRVLTANESPPEQPIPFHHEMAQVPHPPGYVFFCCEIPPEEGGTTPIVHSHQVYRRFQALDPEFCAHLTEHGARYVRVMPPRDDPSSPIGRSWRATFQSHAEDEAEARAHAEEKMRESGTTWRWLESGDLYTETAPVPAIRIDERSGKETFFNSIVAAYTGWVDERNDPTQAVKCGDGTPVKGEVLLATAEAMREEQVMLTWRTGDQMWIDNRLVMHSRQPFRGERRILAAIAPSS